MVPNIYQAGIDTELKSSYIVSDGLKLSFDCLKISSHIIESAILTIEILNI